MVSSFHADDNISILSYLIFKKSKPFFGKYFSFNITIHGRGKSGMPCRAMIAGGCSREYNGITEANVRPQTGSAIDPCENRRKIQLCKSI
jgi:hypothetical protein